MRQRFDDTIFIDGDGLAHFPDDWTEEAKRSWIRDRRIGQGLPGSIPGLARMRKVRGIYREAPGP